jgi:uncharacterized cupin superfamily protein
MSASVTPVVRLSDATLEISERGTAFGSADAHRLGTAAGLRTLGFTYTVVEPGRSGAPFHNHHAEDEMFVVLEGEGTYRFGEGRHAFEAGDVLVAPAGGHDTAHQIINTGSVPLRMVAISSQADLEVCEYPDSGKFLVSSRDNGNGAKLRHIGRHPEQHLDYWDGEPGA